MGDLINGMILSVKTEPGVQKEDREGKGWEPLKRGCVVVTV